MYHKITIIYIISGIGIIVLATCVKKYIERYVQKEIDDSLLGSRHKLYVSILMLIISGYSFFNFFFKKIVWGEILAKGITATTILVALMLIGMFCGLLIMFGFFATKAFIYYRYLLIFTVLYMGIAGIFFTVVFKQPFKLLFSLMLQARGIYDFFMTMLFPGEIGIFLKKIKNCRKN